MNRTIRALVLAALLVGCTSTHDMQCGDLSGVDVCIKMETAPFTQLNTPVLQTITVVARDGDLDDVSISAVSANPGYVTFSGTTTWTVDLRAGAPVMVTTFAQASSYGSFSTGASVWKPPLTTPVDTLVRFEVQSPNAATPTPGGP